MKAQLNKELFKLNCINYKTGASIWIKSKEEGYLLILI